jgi:hypothetical protein
VIDESLPYEIFDPIQTWKRKSLTNFTVRKILAPIFRNGECVYEQPSILEMRSYCEKEVETLWESVKRFENPQTYYVDLSLNLWNIRNEILHSSSEQLKTNKTRRRRSFFRESGPGRANRRKSMENKVHPTVRIEMENGSIIRAELYEDIAPISVKNFYRSRQQGIL